MGSHGGVGVVNLTNEMIFTLNPELWGPFLKHCLLDFIFAKQKYVQQDHSLGAGDTHTVLGDYSFCLSVELMFSTLSMCSFVLVLHYFCSQENNIAIYLKNWCLFKYRNFVIRIHTSSITGH